MSEFMTIGGRVRRVPAALFGHENPREAVARWAADPEAVEAELAVTAAAAEPTPTETAIQAGARLALRAAAIEAGIRAADLPVPAETAAAGRPSRRAEGPRPVASQPSPTQE